MLGKLWEYTLSIMSTVKDMRDGTLLVEVDNLYDLESDLEIALKIVQDMIEQKNEEVD